MAKKTRVPNVVGNLPVVGGVAKAADAQAQWVQQLVEEQARLVSNLPETLKVLNDSIATFQATVETLDGLVRRVDAVTEPVLGPLEQIGPTLEHLATAIDRSGINQIPDLIDSVRSQALPALATATNTQKQIELVAASVDKLVSAIGEMLGKVGQGANLLGRLTGGHKDEKQKEPVAEFVAPVVAAPAKVVAAATRAPAKKAPAKKATPRKAAPRK